MIAANGDEVELDPEPLEFRLDLAGQVMRSRGEAFAAYVGGYRLDSAEWFSGFGRNDEESDDEAGWQWYATHRPLAEAADGSVLYGEHYLTCPAVSLPAKRAKLHSDGEWDVIARDLRQALSARQQSALRASEHSESADSSAHHQAKAQESEPDRNVQLGLF